MPRFVRQCDRERHPGSSEQTHASIDRRDGDERANTEARCEEGASRRRGLRRRVGHRPRSCWDGERDTEDGCAKHQIPRPPVHGRIESLQNPRDRGATGTDDGGEDACCAERHDAPQGSRPQRACHAACHGFPWALHAATFACPGRNARLGGMRPPVLGRRRLGPMATTNDGAARMLQELADLMKLAEGSPQSFRVRAYEKAVGAIRELSTDVADMTSRDLETVDGIGASTAKKIREFVETGSLQRVEQLREQFPPEFVELTRIPGVGPKTAVMMRDRLGVANVEQLRAALEANKVRELPGMGAKSEEKIAKAIERLGLHGKDRRTPIQQAMPIARELVEALEALPQVRRATYCGSLRRFRETIGDIDIVAAANDPLPVMDAFLAFPIVDEVIGHGETKSSVLTAAGLQIDLRVVAPSQYGAATLYFTGSKQHNIELRQRAIERGWTLNEYALADVESGAVISSRTEKSIYNALDLSYVAPELREGIGEVAAAAENDLPALVTIGDIKGDLHVHSTWSGDGRSSLDEMVAAAAERGLQYVAITEHGEDLSINGLSRDEVRAEAVELARLREEYPDLTLLHGAELNIAPDGSLDYDADFLMAFDWCVASVHSHFDLPQAAQTARLIAAIAHPAVNVIGHPTGRMIGRRPGIEFDLDAVLDAAAESATALEINCHLDRLDLPSDLLRRASGRSDVSFLISTDAHHTREFDHLQWGIANARRGWVAKRQIANTWSKDRFLKWAGRSRAAASQ